MKKKILVFLIIFLIMFFSIFFFVFVQKREIFSSLFEISFLKDFNDGYISLSKPSSNGAYYNNLTNFSSLSFADPTIIKLNDKYYWL